MQKSKRLQSHGLTHQQIKDLKYDQMNDNQEFTEANKNPNFVIPSCEEHLIHANIELKTYSPTTGDKTSVAKLQSFYPEEFNKMESQGAFIGYDVEIVHQPKTEDAPLKLHGGKRMKIKEEDKSDLGEGADILKNGEQILKDIADGKAVGSILPLAPKGDKKDTDQKTGTDTDQKNSGKPAATEKPLSRLSKAELIAKYTEVWGESPADDATAPVLLEAIKEKLGLNDAE